jgi:asparagine synthetase B (glutamine-hydrolysing)
MNKMTGIIYWQSNNQKKFLSDKEFDNGSIQLSVSRSHNFIFDERAIFFCNKRMVLCSILGYITNLSEIRKSYSLDYLDDVEVIEKLYEIIGIELFRELDGVYLGLIYDENQQKCYIFQSSYGFGLPLYYSMLDEGIVFSTSLRQVLKFISVERRELNTDAVRDFLYYESLIPNGTTLIKNISKLVAPRYMVIDCTNNLIEINMLRGKPKNYSSGSTNLIDSIDQSISNIYNSLIEDQTSMALTGGWDSNYLLYKLREISDKRICTVTIDGGGEKNEVPVTKLVLKEYENVDHHVGRVDRNSLHLLPEIVWRYEGYIFQEGMFLRYELSKLLNELGCQMILLTACADQVLYQRPWFIRLLKKIEEILVITTYSGKQLGLKEYKFRRGNITPTSNQVQNLEIEYLLKMHDIMNNSYQVQSAYPFLDRNIKKVCEELGIRNRRKKLYISELKQIMGPDITRHLDKSGAVVDTSLIYDENQDILSGILEHEFIREFLTKSQIDFLREHQRDYHLFIIQLVYIYFFSELYISGKFDLLFDHQSMPMKLEEIIN